jgi:hypothetical protein
MIGKGSRLLDFVGRIPVRLEHEESHLAHANQVSRSSQLRSPGSFDFSSLFTHTAGSSVIVLGSIMQCGVGA